MDILSNPTISRKNQKENIFMWDFKDIGENLIQIGFSALKP
jgi:hypothetical protein